MNKKFLLKPLFSISLFLISVLSIQAQKDNNNNYVDSLKQWSFHFQSTIIPQIHSKFNGGNYKGKNTLSAQGDTALSVTTTLFIGRKLWKGAALYFNPEVAGGRGLGHRDNSNPYDENSYTASVGVAGFPNGETFRIGSAKPALYVARFYIEQIIALSDVGIEEVKSENNQIKQQLPLSRLVITAGKFSIADMFDNNAYAHDPRTRFMNWSLMDFGAWDYSANTRGYTYGLVVELIKPDYEVRFGATLMPTTANGNVLDWRISKAGSINLEFQRGFKLFKNQGNVKILAFRNVTKAPAYLEAANRLNNSDTTIHNYILNGYNDGGVKYGFGISLEQPINKTSGFFARVSWNDGKTATWAFTEIDRSYTIGLNYGGSKWRRRNDVVGIALATNGISSQHRTFLNTKGGYGFIIGDGSLPNYKMENIFEIYYKAQIASTLFITADYQLIGNPAYNADRGQVNFFALRTHLEF